MLYYVLVYECVLVQMLSARSGVLSFNRLSNHLFPTVHMRSLIIIIIIIIISLFNEDDILSYRLSNIWSSTMKLVQICSVVVLQVSCHLCQFELRLNHFTFVNILCSFIVLIPLGLRASWRLLHIQVVAVCIFVILAIVLENLTVSPNLILMNIHVYYENG